MTLSTESVIDRLDPITCHHQSDFWFRQEKVHNFNQWEPILINGAGIKRHMFVSRAFKHKLELTMASLLSIHLCKQAGSLPQHPITKTTVMLQPSLKETDKEKVNWQGNEEGRTNLPSPSPLATDAKGRLSWSKSRPHFGMEKWREKLEGRLSASVSTVTAGLLENWTSIDLILFEVSWRPQVLQDSLDYSLTQSLNSENISLWILTAGSQTMGASPRSVTSQLPPSRSTEFGALPLWHCCISKCQKHISCSWSIVQDNCSRSLKGSGKAHSSSTFEYEKRKVCSLWAFPLPWPQSLAPFSKCRNSSPPFPAVFVLQ